MDDIKPKTDPQQLKGILEQFPDGAVIEALKNMGFLPADEVRPLEGAHCFKTVKDFPDPGPEVKKGKDSRCELADLPLIERLISPAINFLPAHFLDEGSVVQRAVARVTLTEAYANLPAGSGWATGLMVSPTLFLTNNHVIPTKAFANKIEMQFNYQLDYSGAAQTTDDYMPNPNDNAFHTNSALDYTLIRMKPKLRFWYPSLAKATAMDASGTETADGNGEAMAGGMPVFGPEVLALRRTAAARDLANMHLLWRYFVNPGSAWGYVPLVDGLPMAIDQHLNIVQHPRGRRKEVALQENQITNIYSNVVRYTTDTEPGSSGSPVFNNAWEIIALHHAAGSEDAVGNWADNEGMRIDKIIADLRSHFGGITGGAAILSELGL
ncbi:MAG: trypsin-like peptidase domain-containing protein [Proteobacteria bacterium]|nr:trypsin-like peptidase domain-containing protein [Pseudomonadota bacterium]